MRTFLSATVFALILCLLAGTTNALDIFLDSNTDNDPDTFVNTVVGPEIAPIDIIVSLDADDRGGVSFWVTWHFGGCDNPECNPEIRGSIDYNQQLPDLPPFTNIMAFTCVCGVPCCDCDAQMLVQADVTPGYEPGNYVLARLNFSRWGTDNECEPGDPPYSLWPQAIFEVHCFTPCDNPDDPRRFLFLQESATSSGEETTLSTWGRVKGLYR